MRISRRTAPSSSAGELCRNSRARAERFDDDFAKELSFPRMHPDVRIADRFRIDEASDNDRGALERAGRLEERGELLARRRVHIFHRLPADLCAFRRFEIDERVEGKTRV